MSSDTRSWVSVAPALQLAVRRYIAWIYWLAVTMVAIFGTMAADILRKTSPFTASTPNDDVMSPTLP